MTVSACISAAAAVYRLDRLVWPVHRVFVCLQPIHTLPRLFTSVAVVVASFHSNVSKCLTVTAHIACNAKTATVCSKDAQWQSETVDPTACTADAASTRSLVNAAGCWVCGLL